MKLAVVGVIPFRANGVSFFASFCAASDIRFDARPVGAHSERRSPSVSNMRIYRADDGLFCPVPGPPVNRKTALADGARDGAALMRCVADIVFDLRFFDQRVEVADLDDMADVLHPHQLVRYVFFFLIILARIDTFRFVYIFNNEKSRFRAVFYDFKYFFFAAPQQFVRRRHELMQRQIYVTVFHGVVRQNVFNARGDAIIRVFRYADAAGNGVRLVKSDPANPLAEI